MCYDHHDDALQVCCDSSVAGCGSPTIPSVAVSGSCRHLTAAAALGPAEGTSLKNQETARHTDMPLSNLWTCKGCFRVFNTFAACNMHVVKAPPKSACRRTRVDQHEIAEEPYPHQQHVGLPSRRVHETGGTGAVCTSDHLTVGMLCSTVRQGWFFYWDTVACRALMQRSMPTLKPAVPMHVCMCS